MKKTAAFTLIEILVVATIIILLTAMSIASFAVASKSARDAKRKGDLETVRQAMVLYRTQNASGQYPTSATFDTITSALITANTLSPPAPVDPKNVSPYVYSVNNSTTTQFCFCTQMENPGNSNASSTCDFSAATKTHYCVRHP